jgi:hypothetical protein
MIKVTIFYNFIRFVLANLHFMELISGEKEVVPGIRRRTTDEGRRMQQNPALREKY